MGRVKDEAKKKPTGLKQIQVTNGIEKATFWAKNDVIYHDEQVKNNMESFMLEANKLIGGLEDPGFNLVITSFLDEGTGVHKGKGHKNGIAVDLRISRDYHDNVSASPEYRFWNEGKGYELRKKYGVKMVNPYHGTAPHFHMELSNEANQLSSILPEDINRTQDDFAFDDGTGYFTPEIAPEVARGFVYDYHNEDQKEKKAKEADDKKSETQKKLEAAEARREQIMQDYGALSTGRRTQQEQEQTQSTRGLERRIEPIAFEQNPYLAQQQQITDDFIFEDGGSVDPSAISVSEVLLERNKNVPFVKRIADPTKVKPLDRGDGDFSTHSMAAEVDEEGQWYVFPTVVEKEGKLVDLLDDYDIQEVRDMAIKSGNVIKAPSMSTAINLSENYKKTNFAHPSFKEYKDGGSIPDRYKNKGFTKVGKKKRAPKGAKHKWEVLAKKGDKYKIVKGGYRGMDDFSQHKSKERQKRFWDRMGGKNSAKAKDPFSPLYWHKRFGTWEDGGEVGEKIGKLKDEGYPQDQAVAIALSMKEKGYYEDGGLFQDKVDFQAFLNTQGYTDAQGQELVEDGVLGVKTGEAVRKFQERNNLVADGIIGKNTLKAMSRIANNNATQRPVPQEENTATEELTEITTPEPTVNEPTAPIKRRGSIGREELGVDTTATEAQGIKQLDAFKAGIQAVPVGEDFNSFMDVVRESVGTDGIVNAEGRLMATSREGETFHGVYNLPEMIKARVAEQNKQVVSPVTSKKQVKLEPEYKRWDEVKDRNLEIKKMSDLDKITEYHKDNEEKYLVVDKKKGTMYVYQGNTLLGNGYDVITGRNEGDARTKTVAKLTNKSRLQELQRLVGVEDDGIWGDNTKLALEKYNQLHDTRLSFSPKWQADFSKGNKSTGAGVFQVTAANEVDKHYRNVPSFTLQDIKGVEIPMAIHAAPRSRDRLFGKDHTDSNGCINGKCSDMKDLFYNQGIGEGVKVYVLPEDEGNSFEIENGVLGLKSSRDLSEYQTYTDAQGVERKGVGVDVFPEVFKTNYNPIKFQVDEEAYLNYTNNIKGNINHNNVGVFLKTLQDSKKEIMDLVGINGDTYNEVAEATTAIFAQESSFGQSFGETENVMRGAYSYLLDSNAGRPDVYFEAVLGDKNNSLGLTQLRWTSLDKGEKELLKSKGIENSKQFTDPKTAALGTALILAYRAKNRKEVSKADFEDKKSKLLNTWNPGESYASSALDRFNKSGITLYELH